MEKTKLKPCPFCGSDGRFHYSDVVRCSNFDCDVCYTDFGVEAWNTRPFHISESGIERALINSGLAYRAEGHLLVGIIGDSVIDDIPRKILQALTEQP